MRTANEIANAMVQPIPEIWDVLAVILAAPGTEEAEGVLTSTEAGKRLSLADLEAEIQLLLDDGHVPVGLIYLKEYEPKQFKLSWHAFPEFEADAWAIGILERRVKAALEVATEAGAKSSRHQ